MSKKIIRAHKVPKKEKKKVHKRLHIAYSESSEAIKFIQSCTRNCVENCLSIMHVEHYLNLYGCHFAASHGPRYDEELLTVTVWSCLWIMPQRLWKVYLNLHLSCQLVRSKFYVTALSFSKQSWVHFDVTFKRPPSYITNSPFPLQASSVSNWAFGEKISMS